ncbi:hypothetical protein E2320_004432 [Naja naja]|nr:hypothetical protein E2320_004432 [Naja naja]
MPTSLWVALIILSEGGNPALLGRGLNETHPLTIQSLDLRWSVNRRLSRAGSHNLCLKGEGVWIMGQEVPFLATGEEERQASLGLA